MSKQPEALRLAKLLDEECVVNWIHATGGAPRACGTKPHKLSVDAAAELRRLHAANAELVAALEGMLHLDEEDHQCYPGDEDVCLEVRQARAALSNTKDE